MIRDYGTRFVQTRDRLAAARNSPAFEDTLRDVCRHAFRAEQMGPSELIDYMVVSTPGVFEEAGYSEAEIDSIVHALDRVVEEEWAARSSG
jgi:hypothetical protein